MGSVYRTINTSFWTDPKVRGLSPDGKLLMLYLVTCPHAHVGGIYYLPEVIALHETGFSKRVLDTLWDTLSGSGLAFRDRKTEIIWVVNMLRYQGRGFKVFSSVATQLLSLHKSPLIKRFLQKYPPVAVIYNDRVSDTPSEFGNPDQDMDKDNDQEQDQESYCGEAEKSALPPLVTFPTCGKAGEAKEWHLHQDHVSEWSEAYPGIDVLGEARKALAWVKAAPERRKTARGMAKFLTGWLSRSQNNGGGRGGPIQQQIERPILDLGIGNNGNE